MHHFSPFIFITLKITYGFCNRIFPFANIAYNTVIPFAINTRPEICISISFNNGIIHPSFFFSTNQIHTFQNYSKFNVCIYTHKYVIYITWIDICAYRMLQKGLYKLLGEEENINNNNFHIGDR